MKNYLKVKDYEGLYRDPQTGAILNMDSAAYQEHLKKKQEAQKKYLAEKAKENEINTLKNDVKELKDMFKQLLDKLNNGNS